MSTQTEKHVKCIFSNSTPPSEPENVSVYDYAKDAKRGQRAVWIWLALRGVLAVGALFVMIAETRITGRLFFAVICGVVALVYWLRHRDDDPSVPRFRDF